MRWGLYWARARARWARRGCGCEARGLDLDPRDRVSLRDPYRSAPVGLVARPAPPPPPRQRRPEIAVRLPGDLMQLQKLLIGDVLGGRCSHAEALGRWREAVAGRHEECRVLASFAPLVA